MRRPKREFWKGRRVVLTGHTGFKGAWLAMLLDRLGARVSGIALAPEPRALFALIAGATSIDHQLIDIRDRARLSSAILAAKPSVVFHLAAQALVGRGYRDPAGTFATNVTGTIHLLDALRDLPLLDAALLVTSDKVYRNDNSGRRFVESDPLGGEDPYSASKAACEIAIASWRASFPDRLGRVVVARAGNVIGGGDFGEARLIPDAIIALNGGTPLVLRYPRSTRPWQHVLDVLTGYLLYAEDAAADPGVPAALNFGPEDGHEYSAAEMIDRLSSAIGRPIPWTQAEGEQKPEAKRLGLDSARARARLDWRQRHDLADAVARTARWYAAQAKGEDMARWTKAACEEVLG